MKYHMFSVLLDYSFIQMKLPTVYRQGQLVQSSVDTGMLYPHPKHISKHLSDENYSEYS